eukprot:TRINITY_DN713_c0_g1_i1.p1 TRINITY_DN713_c0_g1~~TRINITY_DN713_c0_g1_i1.p1  ORF type:complete len:308 (+),score=24.57 TRINITY_DN713_c0_g1_i1:55-978(+)
MGLRTFLKNNKTPLICIILTLSTTLLVLILLTILSDIPSYYELGQCFQTCGNSECSFRSIFEVNFAPLIFVLLAGSCCLIAIVLDATFFIGKIKSKKLVVGYILTMVPVIVSLHIIFSLLLVDYGRFKGSVGAPGYYKHYYSNQNFYCSENFYKAPFELLFSPILAFITYMTSVASIIFHYLFVNTLDGPTLSDYVKTWYRNMISYLKTGTTYVTFFLESSTVVKIKLENDRHYVEIELQHNTLSELESAIRNEFGIKNIDKILKDGDTLISSDSDVNRLFTRDKIIVVPLELTEDDESEIDDNFNL